MRPQLLFSRAIALLLGKARLFFIVMLIILAACSPQGATPLPSGGSTAVTFVLPDAWVETESPTATFMVPPADRASPTLTITETQTQKPTRAAEPTFTETAVSTRRPTPTRGLPPTATFSPKEDCPPPTYAKVDIHFEEHIRDYSPQILEYIRGNGNAAGLQARLEKLGIQGKKLVDYLSGEKVDYFFNDIVQLFSGDMTGDLNKETVITLLQFEGNDLFGWPSIYSMAVFMVGCRDGEYQLLFSPDNYPELQANPRWTGTLTIRDLNADGIRELVFSSGIVMSAHGDVAVSTQILEWNGQSMRSLISPEGGYPEITSLNAALEFQDVDGNGTIEALSPDNGFPIYCGWGPFRIAKTIYMWDGEYYHPMWVDPGVPKFRFQAAFDGDYFAQIGLYDKSEGLYRKAIDDSSLKSFSHKDGIWCSNPTDSDADEPQLIRAYARFRLLELLVYLHKTGEAGDLRTFLSDHYQAETPGYLFASMAAAFWDSYQATKKIDDACASVKELASQSGQERFGLMNYGKFNPGPTLDTICPFHSSSG